MSYRYKFDPSGKKYPCPGCGKKSFAPHIDTETGALVDESRFGRCDRENACGYYVSPGSDPEFRKKQVDYKPQPQPRIVQVYPERKLWRRYTDFRFSPLHTFLYNYLEIPIAHMAKWGMFSDCNRTVFLYCNAQKKVCNIKWFQYLSNGHRDKNIESFSLKQPKQVSEDVVQKYIFCLFGEHLLDPDKIKPVCIVESEKSAVIASYFYPQYDWVACGSNNGLTDGKDGRPDKITPLLGRKVAWLCDADKASRMQFKKNYLGENEAYPSSVRHLMQNFERFYYVDLFPDRTDGYDIGDAIVDGLRPEIFKNFSTCDNKTKIWKNKQY